MELYNPTSNINVYVIFTRVIRDILEAIISGNNITPKEISVSSCSIKRPVIKDKVLWRDVAPIIQKKCTVCHNPYGSGLIDYTNYEDVAGRYRMFKYVIENDLMPPWPLDPNTGPWKNDLSLTPKEKLMLLKWIEDGKPKQSQKPQLLWTKEKNTYATSDYTIHLPEKVVVPSEGLNDYKVFIIQTNFKEDKWIRSVRFRLKPKVIHHMWLFVLDNSFKNYSGNRFNIRDYMLTAFGTAGDKGGKKRNKSMSQNQTSKEIGYKLPRGSKLAIEIHGVVAYKEDRPNRNKQNSGQKQWFSN